jgi:LysM repeat protein
VVQVGDTVSALARRLGVTVEAIARANPGLNLDWIRVGDRLKLP